LDVLGIHIRDGHSQFELHRPPPANPVGSVIEALRLAVACCSRRLGHVRCRTAGRSLPPVSPTVTARYVCGIVARDDSDPERMKPSPDRVSEAVRMLGAENSDCTLIGDSTSDVRPGTWLASPSSVAPTSPAKPKRWLTSRQQRPRTTSTRSPTLYENTIKLDSKYAMSNECRFNHRSVTRASEAASCPPR
jgi:hypothetical protein